MKAINLVNKILPKVKNPLAEDSLLQRLAERKCRKEGCIKTSRVLMMLPQAYCCRCGHRNPSAREGLPKWEEPEGFFC